MNKVYTNAKQLSLGIEFDQHFSVYCLEEFERDVSELFTPDVMQLFIDKGSEYDFEIINNEFYAYGSSKFNFYKQDTYRNIFEFLPLAKRVNQWAVAYRDYRQVGGYISSRTARGLRDLSRSLFQRSFLLQFLAAIVLVILLAYFAEDILSFFIDIIRNLRAVIL